MKIAIYVLLMVVVFVASSWVLIEGFRSLSEVLFIPYEQGDYLHLTGNAVINQSPFLLFSALLLIFALSSLPSSYWSEWQALPKRDLVLRQARKKKLNTKTFNSLWKLMVVALLIATPGMRQYSVLANNEIVKQSWYSLHPEVYPLKQVRCIERSTSNRGAVFQTLYFQDGRQLVLSGLDTRVKQIIQQHQSEPVSNDCRAIEQND
jgi:hypothetical protein